MQYTAAILAIAGLAAAQSQIADGQIQAPTSATVAPISQISDGQVQAPTSATIAPISQISDGQVQAPTSASTGIVPPPSNGTLTTPTAPAATFTGAANILAWSQEMAMVAVGAAAGAALL